MSQAVKRLSISLVGLVLGLGVSAPASGDSLRVTMQREDLGPFDPGLGGFIDFVVALEMFDSEFDGVDTQGIDSVAFNILTDTGLEVPSLWPALTGEVGVFGLASITDDRYSYSLSEEAQFRGGYGLNGSNLPFGGLPQDDDLIGIGQILPLTWEADVQPNAPGLQPRALLGIGYDERPAGGDWLFAEGQIPIPIVPGLYSVALAPYTGSYLLPGLDFSIDHESAFRGAFEEQQLIGDSFNFTVLPEPGSVCFGAISAALLLRMRRSRNRFGATQTCLRECFHSVCR